MCRILILIFCIQAVLIQSTLSLCISDAPLSAVPGLAASGPAPAIPVIEVTPTNGGSLPVTSTSLLPLENIVVASENTYEGALSVAGELPFVGTVGLDGVLPSAGLGTVSHACGTGPARITSSDFPRISSSAVSGIGIHPSPLLGFSSGYESVAYPASGRNSAYLGSGVTGGAYAYPGYGYGRGAASPGALIGGSRYSNAFDGSGALPRITGSRIGNAGGLGFGVVDSTAYGGVGEGNVEVAGELPVVGDTVVFGEVPILGAVSFGGTVPAHGTVTISGFCSCGCSTPFLW